RLQLRFSDDQNVVLANLLAGEAHVAMDSAIPQVPEALMQQWSSTGAGTIFSSPSQLQYMGFQLRPEMANPRAVLDPRVRKAFAHAVDKQAISDAIYGGQAVLSDTPVCPCSEWGAAMDASVTRYPYDPRAADGLLNQAGISKGPDGFYRGPDGRISPDMAITEDPDSVRQIVVMADLLRGLGLDAQQRVIPRALAQDAETRATFPALQLIGVGLGEIVLQINGSSEIPSAANHWVGFNRGAWASPEYDRLLGLFNTTLERRDRLELVRQMLRVYSEETPSFGMFFRGQAFAFISAVKGPTLVAPEANIPWNIYAWEFN
ncbi:MAG TPA: ABC transporter substrate-binding protein, partial [Chloroflexota bacterium]